jgi:hypothetical protein
MVPCIIPKEWTTPLFYGHLLDGEEYAVKKFYEQKKIANNEIKKFSVLLVLLCHLHLFPHKGLSCGNEGFIRKLSDKVGRDLSFKKRGRPKKALHPYGKKRNPNNPVNRKEWDKDKKKGDATLLS